MQIIKFNDYDDVIKRANDSIYGLGAGIGILFLWQNINIFIFKTFLNKKELLQAQLNCIKN